MKVGFTCSTFDLLHSGHVTMLEDARSQCDYLICGLQVDPTLDRPEKNSPIQSVVERYTQLKALSCVDEIVPYAYEKDLEDILSMYNIDVQNLFKSGQNQFIGGCGRNISFKVRFIPKRAHNFFLSSAILSFPPREQKTQEGGK